MKVAEAQTTHSEEQVKRLQVLALDLYTYRAQALEILGPHLQLRMEIWPLEAIRTGLSNPAIQIDAVESQAKIARNRLANAVLHARHLVSATLEMGTVLTQIRASVRLNIIQVLPTMP